MESIASALEPIQAVLWGDRAIGELGAPLVCEHYMLVVDDAEYDQAVGQLRWAGFRDCNWSFSTRSPDFYQDDPIKERGYRNLVRDYSNLDNNSTRFLFPSGQQDNTTKTVLLRSSYAHIRPSGGSRTPGKNIQYPDASLLLLSLIQTFMREPVDGLWTSNLRVWAISYLYGELKVSDDILDWCDDAQAKAWFNEGIKRYEGGIDRVTCTKRIGKMNRAV